MRATSTITVMLGEGAEFVKPVLNVEEALRFKEEGCVIAGERGGIKLPGFDFGNSPMEFLKTDIRGKRFVLTTTNGTKALSFIKCESVYAASFLNISAVVNLLSREDDVDLVCSGTEGEFSLEDFLLAGKIVHLLGRDDLNDAARVAGSYASGVKDIFGEISKSFHASKLKSLGFDEDVRYCSTMDLYEIVPFLDNGVFRI